MARHDPPDLIALLDDWCKSLESGDPDRIASLYDAKATVAYMDERLLGREEVKDTVRSIQHKLQSLQVITAVVEYTSPQRLRFHVTVEGRFGRWVIDNDWTVRNGRIRDHLFRVAVRDHCRPQSGRRRAPMAFKAA